MIPIPYHLILRSIYFQAHILKIPTKIEAYIIDWPEPRLMLKLDVLVLVRTFDLEIKLMPSLIGTLIKVKFPG